MHSSGNGSEAAMVNVLEELVIKEVRLQLSALPELQQKKMTLVEIAAYVLNRMQPMYATNRDGWGHQREKALRSVGQELKKQVARAIVKMRNSPARMTRPLPETIEARSSLNQLRVILKDPELTWLDVPHVVEKLVARAGQAI